jgi:hypothetical protein
MVAVLNVNLSKEHKFRDYLYLINGILNLTDKEVAILAEFIKVMFETGEANNIFTTEIRKKVAETFNIQNVNTYVKKFIDRELVTKKGENYYPAKMLIPQTGGLKFQFVWT